MSDSDGDDFLEKGKIPALVRTVPEIKALVSLLQCQICYQLMISPVMTLIGCSHNFCSVCVRSHLKHQQNCPSCFQELHETKLKSNKILQEIIIQFKLLLPKLADCRDVRYCNGSSNTTSANTTITSQGTWNSSQSQMSSTKEIEVTSEVINSKTVSNASSLEAPLTLRTSAAADQAAPPKGFVSCPVCSENIPASSINRHLDECLNSPRPSATASTSDLSSSSQMLAPNVGHSQVHKTDGAISSFFQSSQSFQAQKRNTMKPVTKVVYHMLRDTQLRDLLKKEGLDTKGNRKTLISRHQKFSILWNAQCEEDSPMSRAEIIRAVKREEQNLLSATQSSSNSSRSSQSIFKYDRKTDPKVIDQERQEILQANQSSFKKLVEDLKRRKMMQSDSKATSSQQVEQAEDEEEETEVNKMVSEEDQHQRRHSSEEDIFEACISSDEDFLMTTPKADNKKSFFNSKETTESMSLHSTPKKQDSLTTPVKGESSQRKSSGASGITPALQGQLYVTPKRKSSRELLFDNPKRLRQQVLDSEDPSGSQRSSPGVRRSECPICQSSIALNLMDNHVDKCIASNAKRETRQSKTRRENPTQSDYWDHDSDFEPESRLTSSPDFAKSPPITSTVKKCKRKKFD